MEKLIICDIDGCLNSKKLEAFDLDTLGQIRAQIKNLAAENIGFTLCTGRPQPYVEAMATILDVKLPMICEYGAVLFDPIHDGVTGLINSQGLEDVKEAQKRIEQLPWFGKDCYLEFGKSYSHSIVGPYLQNQGMEKLGHFAKELSKEFSDLNVELTNSYASIDVMIKGVNKGSSLSHLREKLATMGHNPNSYIGIGDSTGDMSFLSLVDQVMCPQNAASCVKEIADVISEQTYAKGTLELLKQLK